MAPKNETIQGSKKKAEPVFIKELHSHPELMAYSEKLELAEEIFCEILSSVLEREGIEGSVQDVKGDQMIFRLNSSPSMTAKLEMEYLVKETTQGVFSAKFVEES